MAKRRVKKKVCARKKVIRKKGNRYYRSRTGRLVKLKGNKKPPRKKC